MPGAKAIDTCSLDDINEAFAAPQGGEALPDIIVLD
jgi:hypothetical protein